jgi:hypothetical protein
MLMNRITPTAPSVPQSNRGASRAPISIRCEVRQGTRAWQLVLLEDLSASGFRIAGLMHADAAKPLSIRIPGMQLLTARICWNVGSQVGCEFSAPLYVAVFDHLVRQARAI